MTVVLRRACASPAEAERLRRAVAPDNPPYVRVEVDGSDLLARVTAPSAASVRASLDDLLACVGAAERAGRADK